MAHSNTYLDQVLVEYPEGYTRWMTPAQARRAIGADPRIEIIDESSDRYNALLQFAGPKPSILIPATEDYNEEDK